jgi:hypothetical protein
MSPTSEVMAEGLPWISLSVLIIRVQHITSKANVVAFKAIRWR